MRLLLDTHFLIWLASDRAEIRPNEQQLIDDETTELFVSAVTIWELRMKDASEVRRGRAGFVLPPERGLMFCRSSFITLAAVFPDDPATVLVTPAIHHDPFDEMLLVHAQLLGAKLLTRDEKLRHHPLAYHP